MKRHILWSQTCFRFEIMCEKYCRTEQTSEDSYMLIACWITKSTNTHSLAYESDMELQGEIPEKTQALWDQLNPLKIF